MNKYVLFVENISITITTSCGEIRVILYYNEMPVPVNNFIKAIIKSFERD